MRHPVCTGCFIYDLRISVSQNFFSLCASFYEISNINVVLFQVFMVKISKRLDAFEQINGVFTENQNLRLTHETTYGIVWRPRACAPLNSVSSEKCKCPLKKTNLHLHF